MSENGKPTPKELSIKFISKRLEDVLDQMAMITAEIAEMKDREGGEHGDN